MKIQRASAGSGKTYALAKNYIFNLIAIKNENQHWNLRNKKQIEDAILHILAITFTNKATNEMKQRIIKNLASLAEAADKKDFSEEFIKQTPYLKEFKESLNTTFQQIGKAAEYALITILNNYSLFKISTIDSFFQEILRNFAYETNINDNYQLEIDSTFITDAALDEAITELDTHPEKMGMAAFWLRTIINHEAKKTQKWNPFNKKASSKSVYSKLRENLFQLEKEDFKEIKTLLESYFSSQNSNKSLKDYYLNLKACAEKERENLQKQIIKKINDIENIILRENIPDKVLYQSFKTHINEARNLHGNIPFKHTISTKDTVFLKKYDIKDHPLNTESKVFYELLKLWNNPKPDSYYLNWQIYKNLIPYLGILMEIRVYLSKVLENNHLIQLSDTSYILKKIIGDEDTPYIYERIGNRLDNYLLDEFQDTSQMQWDILRPLLKESEAKDNENLIIGDPKQSIYRFRNAKHTLITEIVPNEFPGYTSAGYSKEDNSNWRSNTLIVKFNNYFFKRLSSILNERSKNNGISTDFDDLYSNVVQNPQNNINRGYIEIKLFEKPEKDDKTNSEDSLNEEETKDWFDSVVLKEIGPLISSLVKRGYRQKDISILVNTNAKGKLVVDALMSYNDSLKENEHCIDFISDESLYISSSKAVQQIIGILEKISQPSIYLKLEEKSEKTENENKYYNWNKLQTKYNIYSSQHPELTKTEKIMSFLDSSDFEDSIPHLLASLPTPSLSSLVESIIKTFISPSLKENEGLFISSFQDVVCEFTTRRYNDPASFLEWWKSRGAGISVSAPSGIDAVQIMTIHKSKGLEFKCVVIPFATDAFSPQPGQEEWRWVKPANLEGIDNPPVLPIETSSSLKGSDHEPLYREFLDQIMTDKLNKYYVAFTRAKNELYIFSKNANDNRSAFPNYLKKILIDEFDLMEEVNLETNGLTLRREELHINEEKNLITIGEPFTKKEIKKENERDETESTIKKHYFNEYFINNNRPKLKSVATMLNSSDEAI